MVRERVCVFSVCVWLRIGFIALQTRRAYGHSTSIDPNTSLGLIKQFLTDVDWGELDFLVIDSE